MHAVDFTLLYMLNHFLYEVQNDNVQRQVVYFIVTIPEKVNFYEEKQSKILRSYFY